MANDTITVTYKIKEDGSLQRIEKNATKAAAGTKKASDAAAQYNKQQKGVAGATSNGTKAFSKMTTGITGGLVPAYATLAANIFALTALFGALSKAASLRLLEEGLLRVGSAAGQNLAHVSQGLRDITNNAISTETAMRSTALAVSAGFSVDQLKDLTKVAKGASVALGRDMSDAMDRLVRGTAKLEPEILDELGIMVRLDDAVADYAITLGKTAKDLTQYERRMAFLTATNEQGLKKFGALADAVDVNPYDQLAASFANLAKVATNFLNVVVEPLVKFLSSNPIALSAAVALFAGTLVKQVVPAISASAEAARKMASATQKEVTRLAAKATSDFKKSAQKVGSFKFAPKGLETFETGLRKGVVSSTGLKDAVKKLANAERARQANIDKHHAKNVDYHLKNLAQKEAEIKQIRRLKAELQSLQATETGRATSGGALAGAKGMSSTSRKTAAAFKMMEGAGPLEGFKIAAASTGKQIKDIGKADGALNKLSLSLRVAGNSAKLFGTAMLNAIPIIGQIAMVASLAWPLISKIFDEGAVIDAANDAVDSFASFEDIGKQLAVTLNDAASASERFIATLRAKIGVIEQVKTAFINMGEASKETQKQELRDAMQAKINAKDKVDRIQANIAAQGFATNNQRADLKRAENAVKSTAEAYDKLSTSFAKADRAGSRIILDGAIRRIEENKVLRKSMAGELQGLKDLRERFKKANEKGGPGMSVEELANATDILMGKNKEVVASVDEAKASYSAFREEVLKLGEVGKSKLDPLLGKLNSLNKEMKASGGKGGIGVDAFLAEAPAYKKALDDFRKNKNFKGNTGFMAMPKKDLQVAEQLQAFLQKQSDTMALQKSIQKGLLIDKNKILKFAKANSGALQEIFNIEDAIVDSKVIALTAERDAHDVLKLTEEQKQRILVIDAEIKNLEKEKGETTERTLQLNLANLEHEKALLENTLKIAAAQKQMLADRMKMSDLKFDTKMLKRGRPATELETRAQWKEQRDAKIQMILAEFNSKTLSIDMEYGLLRAQTLLQKERAKNIEVEKGLAEGTLTKGFDELLPQFTKVRAAQMGAAATGLQVAFEQLLNDEAGQDEAVRQGALSAASTGDSAAQRAMSFEQAGGFAALNQVPEEKGGSKARDKLEAIKGMLEPTIEKLMSLGPEGAVVASLTAGSLAINEAYITMGENIAKAGNKTGETAAKLEMAGQVAAQIGNVMAAASAAKIAGIDEEIEAEKRRDGKSEASLAKIAGLEKKKQAVEKKAFNQNKKMQMAMVVINTAASVAANVAAASNAAIAAGIAAPAVFAGVLGMMNGITIALGAAQLAVISSTSYKGGGSIGGGASAPSSVSVGERSNTVDLAKGNNAGGELAYMRGESGQGKGATNYRPTGAFAGVRHRAGGGYVVGEQGPEIFMPDVPGQIMSAGESQNAVGSTITANINIQALDSAGVEGVMIGQKGNIISMIRDAANEHGEFFLEDINTEVYGTQYGGG